ncbi:Crp/Fnr family transcriptional regulator [Chitinophaga arvensicola]|uniref:CRP/FNR family transcriptional regulator, anaerobic regulatory protein n=1 Tax=Chitinophaga arvensicola TaxID=29529 RepID=A0A1I0S4Z4_9BACT|nr:Crp/Fnr family transcriptional regulator [Chitinophaga arvensicola]SEW49855.1 CRP/FNR family transcriptional regulator, anaerobic regulatory protein [Chitinophaga arvensicola]
MEQHPDILTYLNKHFPTLDKDLKEYLSVIGGLKKIPAGEVLLKQGQYIRFTVLVLEGRIKLYREGEEQGEFFMYYLEPGDACAISMICIASGKESEVMAKAVEESVVLMIPVQHMELLMKDYKSWYRFVIESYRRRFEEVLTVLDSTVFKSMDERLLSYIREQSRQLNTRQLKLTHQEIATDINSSREVISRLLKKMEQKGLVKLNRNYIEVLPAD